MARRGLLRRLRRAPALPAAALDGVHDPPPRPPLAGVHGWGLAERGLDRIELTPEGGEPVRARLFAGPRPDVAADASEPSAPLSGWEGAIDVCAAEPGSTLDVAVSAIAHGRRTPLGELELTIQARDPLPDADPQWLRTLRHRAALAVAQAPAPPRDRLRVAVFTHQLDLGGAQLYLHELLRRLIAEPDLKCAVFAQNDGPLRAELESRGVRVHITGQEPRRGEIYEARMSELLPLVAGFRPNAVLVNTSVAFWGVDVAARLGIPSVWAIHESVPVEHYPQLVWPEFDEHLRGRFLAALAEADRVVFEAEATRRMYDPYVAGGASTVIDYGIDLDAIDAERRNLDRERLRAERGIAPDERVILCVGSIEPRKAQASLAFAFAGLAAAHPRARLILVGDNGSDYARALRAAVDRMPDTARIELVPTAAETSPWYELADAFALPSDLESLPRSILEAMAFGLPVLAADAFGVTEIVDHGRNGIVCEPRCLGSLTAALDQLLGLAPADLAELGRGASATVRPSRDAGGYARAYLALLTELALGAEPVGAGDGAA